MTIPDPLKLLQGGFNKQQLSALREALDEAVTYEGMGFTDVALEHVPQEHQYIVSGDGFAHMFPYHSLKEAQ